MHTELELWQICHSELLLLREQLDRLTAVMARLNPGLDNSFHADRAEQIQKWICARMGVTYTCLISGTRVQRFVRPRWLAIWLIRKHCPELSLEAIGILFGGRHNGAIIHAINSLHDRTSVDPAERKFLHDLDEACKAFLAERHLLLNPRENKAA